MKNTSFSKGFDNLEKEQSINNLKITGKIPQWLKGSLIRTSPAKFNAGKKNLRHWFDGYAMLHQFNFNQGEVSYQNRFIQSKAYRGIKKKNKVTRGEFATDPCQNIFQHFFNYFRSPKLTDNANVNVTKVGEEFIAMTETPLPIRFDKKNLTTKGYYKYADKKDGNVTVAHPHFDKENNLYSYLVEFGYQSAYHLYKMNLKTRKRKVFASIPVERPAYMHSFGFTKNYIILTEFPLVVNPLKLKFSRKPFIENYKWKPELGTRFHIVNKHNGHYKTFTGEPIFAFHHVNAWEHDQHIIIDLIGHKNASIIDELYLNNLRNNKVSGAGRLVRIDISLEGRTLIDKVLSYSDIELPKINYAYNGKKYNILHAAANKNEGNFLDSLMRRNLEKEKEIWWHEQNKYPGEPVFVPSPQATREDDGLILSVVLDAEKENSFLLILDAETYKEVARAKLPHHIPFGFHGNFFNHDN